MCWHGNSSQVKSSLYARTGKAVTNFSRTLPLPRSDADRRITLDLDDGVKVNYGKFGDLLAEVRAVTGGCWR